MTPYGRAYVSVVGILGICVVALSAYSVFRTPLGYQWYLLAALTIVSGSATVKLPSVSASISISEAFVFTAILLYGPAAGALTVALDGLVISYWIARRRPELKRAVFNMAAPVLSAWCAAQVFFLTSGIRPLVQQSTSLGAILPHLFLSALTYFLVNSWLIAFAVSAETHAPAIDVWKNNFIWLSLNYFCGASIAGLLVVYRPEVTLPYIGAVVPILIVIYFTFKTTMGRVEDANRHVEKINKMYISTIEALALAIDAKDQVTHGHIRRVQKYALALALEVGVKDKGLLNAIHAAALLHDMGKLAIPEHILNKPAKLSPSEFEQMKGHAAIGADILSSIDFPYPVVPIVRHHHENWDGTGYPTGISGAEIPIGARILAVVDCFDALTSDRPYRPKLTNEQAIAIVLERRGHMYDPLIVDAFIRIHAQVADECWSVDNPEANPSVHAHSERSTQRMQTRLMADVDFGHVLKELNGAVPFSTLVWFSHDDATDSLEATFVHGPGRDHLSGLRIPLGKRLSGWVAANRRPILNSDPKLDLGDLVAHVPGIRSCMSVPVCNDNELVAVVTLFANTPDAYNERHCRSVEAAALGHIAHPVPA